MAELINLNKARKTREKAAKAKRAAENRIKFGRSGAEKVLSRVRDEHAARKLDAHRRDDRNPQKDG